MITISAGVLTMLLLEGVKKLIKIITKNPDFNFETWVFAIVVPVLNALMPFFLVYVLGQQSVDPVLTLDVVGIVRYVLNILLASVATFLGYNDGLKPLKDYYAERKLMKINEELAKSDQNSPQ